jgi:hypothetical protein
MSKRISSTREFAVFMVALAPLACGFSSSNPGGGSGSTGGGAGPGRVAAGGVGAAPGRGISGGGNDNGVGSGSGGMRGPGKDGEDGAGAGGGTSGALTCTGGTQRTIITDCGYPFASSNVLTGVVFNESEVLRAIEPAGSAPVGIVRVFYNDEHALTLGVRQVIVKSASGTVTRDFPVSPLLADPGSAANPQTGSNELVGDTSGLDASLRPMWPALFLTDLTADPSSRAGDWQSGGRPRNPDVVFGSWKAAVRSVDATRTPSTVSILPDPDPAKNDWSLGAGADPVPAGLTNQGFGAEARWNVALAPGHSYRLQVIVHDGDQSKSGGDTGEACVTFCAGGTAVPGSGGSGPPPASCPAGIVSCSGGVIDAASCPAQTVCANGCCLPRIVVP